ARAFEELGDYQEAFGNYQKILHLDPKNAMAYAGMGKIHWVKGDFLEAEKYLLHAASYDDDNYDILLLLGRAMIKNKNFKAADEFLLLARNIKPKEASVYYYRGIAQANLGDPMGTATQFNMYLKYSPDNIPALYNRGFA